MSMIKRFVVLASVLTVLLAAPMAKRVVLENQRVTASEVVACEILPAILAPFCAAYPQIAIELSTKIS